LIFRRKYAILSVVEKIAFLRISKKIVNNKTYLTAAIVKSYRDKEGRSRHKVLNYFGSVTEDMAERLRFVFSKDFNPHELINVKDLEFDEAVDYGNFFLMHHLWKTLELGSHLGIKRYEDEIFTMVTQRLFEPASKNHIIDWFKDTPLKLFTKIDIGANYPERFYKVN
jgi:hypothetical protein